MTCPGVRQAASLSLEKSEKDFLCNNGVNNGCGRGQHQDRLGEDQVLPNLKVADGKCG
jgi:hypothetical protein